MLHATRRSLATAVLLLAACTTPATDPPGSGGPSGDTLPHPCTADDAALTDPLCRNTSEIEPGTVGTGPSLALMGGFSREIRGGFVDTAKNRLVVAVEVTGLGGGNAVLAVDLATGDREVISGEYEDPAEGLVVFGEGPKFADTDLEEIFDVQPGPDGSLYVFADHGVFRVDPANGARSIVLDFTGPPPAGCNLPGEELRHHLPSTTTFAIGPDGTFYFGVGTGNWGNESGGPYLGWGIVAYRDDACTIVSRVNRANPDETPIGTGITPPGANDVHGIRFLDGAIWANTFGDQSLYRVDVATGKRTRVSCAQPAHPVGDGDAVVGTGYLEDAGDGAWLTTGTSIGARVAATLVDRATGDRTALTWATGPGGTQPVWVVPGKPWLVAARGDDSFALIQRDSGDSQIFSY